ncbi:hypothetical protein NDU88_000221 [Pleurodeles waltl]|uniref:Uncharacterized protein n=1 Tax=Pleurodeles waltl TaxID=8319 RepID=A0AAV7S753_PLEWA|nr:hypothetical protein NDU88_000221 [Pleurodeles waltl]
MGLFGEEARRVSAAPRRHAVCGTSLTPQRRPQCLRRLVVEMGEQWHRCRLLSPLDPELLSVFRLDLSRTA